MVIKGLTVGPIMANCYILGCKTSKAAAVIDPGDETDRILQVLAQEGLRAETIINTHGHFDHVGGNRRLKEVTGAELIIHPLDAPMLGELSAAASSWGMVAEDSPGPDRTVDEGDTISIGTIQVEVIHTPGHTPGGICLHTEGHLFTGDTLFVGGIGRTDLPGVDTATLLASIREQILPLPDSMRLFPGHGPDTTVGLERRSNPFVLQMLNG